MQLAVKTKFVENKSKDISENSSLPNSGSSEIQERNLHNIIIKNKHCTLLILAIFLMYNLIPQIKVLTLGLPR